MQIQLEIHEIPQLEMPDLAPLRRLSFNAIGTAKQLDVLYARILQLFPNKIIVDQVGEQPEEE